MGTGDYLCVTLYGGAPWGFTLREGEGDTYTPFLVTQVEEGGRAFLAGVQEGDEVVSLNGEPCVDLTLSRAFALIDTSIDCLQLLVKRHCPEDYEPEEAYCGGETGSPGQALESTTLHILSPKHRSPSPREIYISESLGDEAYHGGDFGDMVELQVSLSQQTMEDDDAGFTSLGSAHGIQGELSSREAVEKIHTTTTTTSSHYVSCPARVPLGQRGVVLSSHTSVPGQVEVIVQQPAASGAGRGILSVGGPPRVTGSSIGSQSEGGGGGGGGEGGHSEGVPGSSTVSFGIPTPAEEKGSDSEGDQDKPNKHHAKHARLRRSESLSEKQVKEAKSKCKRIALLLTAAPPNPNNKGVLMFKKHRQRAKKFTLVSYGTGEDEPEYSDEEDDETHTVEFTLVAPDDSDIEQHFLSNGQRSKGVLTINWDKGLLEIERNLQNQAEMEDLPDTKGKGALMFAQRRLRMDEISAEHEELRRCGIPVEGVPPEEEKKIAEHSYMQQSKTEAQAYMDVNMHQQSQQQQQYQQYQEQQYYEQQQNYQQQQQQQHYQQQQQQQQYQQQQQHYQQQQYEQQQQQQQHYQQQQMYQQQQECHQEQQQMQHYSANVNGAVQHQTSEMQSSLSNRTAKPFMSGPNQDAAGPGEQIASRDERISTPAIKTGLLTDAKKRNTPMFTFKEAPKVSPNPALLNLLSRSGKKLGNESEPEEDYFSLGAEACNFLQSPRVKHKTPPPVAPKPAINPNNLPWSPQMEPTNQDMPQQAENSVCTPAVAPTVETTPAPELEPTSAPALEPSPLPAPQEAIASNTTTTTTEEQHTWAASHQQTLQVTAQEENVHINSTVHSEAAPVTASWATVQTQAHQQQLSTNSWHQAQVQPQEPIPSQSPPQPPWVTRQPIQTQAPPQAPSNAWAPQTQIQPSWSQPQEQAPAQTHAQPPWTQHQEQAQPQQPWTHPQGQPNWGQPQEPMQQQQQQQAQAPWVQPSQTDSQPQPPWVQQPQVIAQAQPPWVQPEPQPQPPWAQQPQHPAQQQAAWQQAPQAPGQPQPPWESAQPQPQQQQPPMNTWPPTQAQSQVQPPWIQAPQEQPPAQPQVNVNPWMPVPAQAQTQPPWAQHPSEPAQQPMNDWAQQQTPAQQQPPWAQPAPPQPIPQPSWQQSPPTPSTQPPLNTWPPQPAQTQPQAPVNAWAPQSQQMPANVSTPLVNTHPSPKPWQPPQNAQQDRTPPPPPQRMHSYTISQRSSSPINPMATVLNPHAPGSAMELPVVKGKGADMFAKRLSRMEMFVVDSESVQANKTSRPISPAPSLPTEWKYTPNALGSRRYSLSPSARVLPSTGQKSTSASCSSSPTKPASRAPARHTTPWPEKGLKAPSPWEAASRHPLGLVDEAFAFQNLQQSLATNIHMAAHRKMLPEPPAEWKARVSSHQAPQKLGSQTWSQQSQSRGQSRAPLPTSFMSPTRSPVSSHASPAGYRSLPRQWQPRTSVTEAKLAGSPVSNSEFYKRPSAKQTYKSVYTSNTWSWQR